jgi:hypothetical protein
MFLLPFHAAPAMIDSAIVNENRCELSGLLSLDSYANNYRVSSQVEFGVNWLRSLNTAIGIDFEYRNFSVKTIETILSSYRFFLGRHELRPGITGGISSQHIGNYSDNSFVTGLLGTYIFNVSGSLSLRAELTSWWFFEHHTVFGSNLLLGMCWSFGRQANP